jgi:2-phosphosulfolactate phosphatase
VSGKTIALTTSGGARCISACGSDKQVIVGSFANANAVLSFVRNLSSGETSFWAVGEKAEETAAEDIACAEFLESQVADSEHEFARILQNLLQSRGADRLRHLGQNVDLDYCVTLNSRHIVPVRADIVDDLSIFVGVLI